MALTYLLVNGVDLATYGLSIKSAPLWDLQTREYQTSPIPGRDGEALLAKIPTVRARSFVVSGWVIAGSAAALHTSLDTLKYLLDIGSTTGVPLDLRFGDDTTRRYNGYCTQLTHAEPPAGQWLDRHVPFQLRFLVPSPYRQDVTISSIAFTAATAMPLGTAPVRPQLIRLSATVNTVTSPIVTLKNSGGTIIGTLDFTGASILTGDKLEVNCDTRTIVKTVSGVASDASALLAAGDFLTLDPRDGDFTTSAWPSLTKASGGAGTLTALCEFYRRWL